MGPTIEAKFFATNRYEQMRGGKGGRGGFGGVMAGEAVEHGTFPTRVVDRSNSSRSI